MKNKLEIINGEKDRHARLKLLVENEFVVEAGKLILDLARTHTTMFYYDGNNSNLCLPLSRVTDMRNPIYVVITSSNRLDYHPATKKEGEWHVIFELGWEKAILNWSDHECLKFVSGVIAQALTRPLSQWSFEQTEGTARTARVFLRPNNRLARMVAALHLVYHFRTADFGRICEYLADVPGFSFTGDEVGDSLTEQALSLERIISWIFDQLFHLGWSSEQIYKEALEWIRLKPLTWPHWLLAVARSKIFQGDDDICRTTAVRFWVQQKFDTLLDINPLDSNSDQVAAIYRDLFTIGQIRLSYEWVIDKLVQKMASGNKSQVKWFIDKFHSYIDFTSIHTIQDRAKLVAAANGDFGIAVALTRDKGEQPLAWWMEIARVRELSTKLS